MIQSICYSILLLVIYDFVENICMSLYSCLFQQVPKNMIVSFEFFPFNPNHDGFDFINNPTSVGVQDHVNVAKIF